MNFPPRPRRVAEYAQLDPADIEPDPGYKSGASVFAPPPLADQVDESGNVAAQTSRAAGDLFAEPNAPASGRATAPGRPGAGKEDKAGSAKGTPVSLAAARAEAARKMRIDRSKYRTIRSLEELERWIARAYDAGQFAIEAKANSIDPMQAELCGIALALGPNDACYVPLSHKQSGDGAGLFAAGRPADQITTGEALDALRPLLESPGILKIGFNIKFNAVMLAQHGVTIRNQDDAQLMAYALDAGPNSPAPG